MLQRRFLFGICILVALLFTSCTKAKYTQKLTISVSQEGAPATTSWEISFFPDGVIASVIRKTIATGEITEEVSVRREGNLLTVVRKDGEYSLTKTMTTTIDGIKYSYVEIIGALSKRTEGNGELHENDGEISDYQNNDLLSTYNYRMKVIKNKTGKTVLQNTGGKIIAENDTIYVVSRKKGQLSIKLESDPQILPPDVYVFSSNFVRFEKESLLQNYAILPYQLSFLLLL